MLYWLVVPARQRRTCIFGVSCSRHVFKRTRQLGFVSGTAAFRARRRQCRPGYRLHSMDGDQPVIRLVDGTLLTYAMASDSVQLQFLPARLGIERSFVRASCD